MHSQITGPKLSLYATGTSNWDLYQDANGYLYSIAKPNSGAQNSCFGYPKHLDRLERSGVNHGYTVLESMKPLAGQRKKEAKP